MTTVSIALNDDTYVSTGSLAVESYQAFADTFHALGGVACGIRPGWALGTDYCVMTVEGTPAAAAYVESVLV